MNLLYLATSDLHNAVNRFSTTTIVVGVLLLVALLVAVFIFKPRSIAHTKRLKKVLFSGIAIVVIGTTSLVVGATFFLNLQAYTHGPVSWRASTEFWVCGNELELRDPSGISDKIGSPTLHEHNDKQIHVEGTPVTPADVSLGQFMHAIGGEVTNDSLVIPLNKNKFYETNFGEEDGDGYGAPSSEEVEPYVTADGTKSIATFVNGQNCGTQKAEVQVFVYKFDSANNTYRQTKLSVPADYTISPQSQTPPGDCVIFEFAPVMPRTNKLCRVYGERDSVRCKEFGIAEVNQPGCTYKEAV